MEPVLLSTSSHLWRGARVTGVGSWFPSSPEAVLVRFADGVEVEGDLLQDRRSGAFALALPSYETAAGTVVAARTWPLSVVAPSPGGSSPVALKLGAPFAG